MPSQLVAKRYKFTDPRKLVTIKDGENAGADIKRALVRYYPAADQTDESIASFKAMLYGLGAEQVRVMPRPGSNVVIAAPRASTSAPMTARRTVLAIVKEGNSPHVAELLMLCGDVMDLEGL